MPAGLILLVHHGWPPPVQNCNVTSVYMWRSKTKWNKITANTHGKLWGFFVTTAAIRSGAVPRPLSWRHGWRIIAENMWKSAVLFTEAPDEFTDKISVLYAFYSWLAKQNRSSSSWEVSEQIHYCFIKDEFSGLAGWKLSQSQLAGNSEQFFQF